MRKTKIVATIGPACDSPDMLRAMIQAGMNVARLNLSHGSYDEHFERLTRIRAAAAELDANVAIMIDTRGIEIRTGKLSQDFIELRPGGSFTLYTHERPGDTEGVSVSFKGLANEVAPGATILLDDGAMELRVQSVINDAIHCQVVHGGTLRSRKSVNLPDTKLSISLVGPENREDVIRELSFASENEVEYIAASFVQSADDIVKMREILTERNVEIPIIAKIENKAGVANLDEIIKAADGLMVARGDLGVELPLADVPGAQKMMIRKTVTNGKPVITATQMLASMEWNPKPTRAEASDVANAILDGSSAVMLSGETAVGKYPVEAVRTMATLAQRAESQLGEYGYLQKILPHPSNVVTEAVSQAAVAMAKQLKAAAIFSLTSTGFTSRLVSKHRPDCPILAITPEKSVARRLAMNWGVLPILYSGEASDLAKIDFGIERASRLGYVRSGDIIIATAGHWQKAGGTDLIRVITLG
ncbi:MAG: pyruvate kinase [Gammaproteobacteria bacterium]|nr:MAG: pyruvate kinase [Gammaproteobacteria bacterium]